MSTVYPILNQKELNSLIQVTIFLHAHYIQATLLTLTMTMGYIVI